MRSIEQTTALVTGATDGLGRGVAERLAAQGADLHIHGRSADRLEAAAAELREGGKGKITTHRADLASLDEVRALSDEVASSAEHLHLLISNAGIGGGAPDEPTRQESRDGHELRFAVNYLAGFLLTARLLPLLRDSAPARVVNVSSLGQAPLDFDDVMLEESYDPMQAYCQSKLAQIIAANYLADRVSPREVTFNSLHPGTHMPTKIVEHRDPGDDSLETGIETVMRVATDRELDGKSGYFFDRQQEAEAQEQAYDEEAQEDLWHLSLELTGEADPLTG
jgi:NAD(P)-dependent dehydrogenase (short-subunit alcohol dehydrogenase family)